LLKKAGILAKLRKLSPDIPVILCSGYDEAQVMAEKHRERPSAFLGKPYQLQDLNDTIRQTLADKKKASPRYASIDPETRSLKLIGR
jgi:DNA-binding NtrC family response regulator